jgi:hypothetical protein
LYAAKTSSLEHICSFIIFVVLQKYLRIAPKLKNSKLLHERGVEKGGMKNSEKENNMLLSFIKVF